MGKYDIATPYMAAYILFKRNGRIPLVLRQNTDWMNNFWGLPAGKVEKNETVLAAAVREAKEEVGAVVKVKDLIHRLTVHRSGPDDDTLWVDIVFEAQSWQGELVNAEPHIHAELAWFGLDDLPPNSIPIHRFYLEQIAAGKTYAEYGWPQ